MATNDGGPAMSRLSMVAASVAAGLSIGAAATVGATLVLQDSDTPPAQGVHTPAVSNAVEYGDRCAQAPCAPAPAVVEPADRFAKQ
ncbi:DUF2613 domain-containing protein [Mycobacterium kubicae]|nr:DUF2613 domain-containing protein [Mycobacterium kubicae]